MTDDAAYWVFGCTPWARAVFDRTLSKLPGIWRYVDEDKAAAMMAAVTPPATGTPPRHAFFLHWRRRVPVGFLAVTSPVGFHLGRLPEQRGGTPLQWRILSGERSTLVTMYRMVEEVDAGPVYDHEYISLEGTAEAVYHRAMTAVAHLITLRLPDMGEPDPQVVGTPKVYPRRTPADSHLAHLPTDASLEALYDLIRMVDAPGYPLAYYEIGPFRLTFRRAVAYGDRLEADVTITKAAEEGEG